MHLEHSVVRPVPLLKSRHKTPRLADSGCIGKITRGLQQGEDYVSENLSFFQGEQILL